VLLYFGYILLCILWEYKGRNGDPNDDNSVGRSDTLC